MQIPLHTFESDDIEASSCKVNFQCQTFLKVTSLTNNNVSDIKPSVFIVSTADIDMLVDYFNYSYRLWMVTVDYDQNTPDVDEARHELEVSSQGYKMLQGINCYHWQKINSRNLSRITRVINKPCKDQISHNWVPVLVTFVSSSRMLEIRTILCTSFKQKDQYNQNKSKSCQNVIIDWNVWEW